MSTPASQTSNAVLALSFGSLSAPAGSLVDHITVTATGQASGNTTPLTQSIAPGVAGCEFDNLPPDTYTFTAQAFPATGPGFGTPASVVATIVAPLTPVTISVPTSISVTQP